MEAQSRGQGRGLWVTVRVFGKRGQENRVWCTTFFIRAVICLISRALHWEITDHYLKCAPNLRKKEKRNKKKKERRKQEIWRRLNRAKSENQVESWSFFQINIRSTQRMLTEKMVRSAGSVLYSSHIFSSEFKETSEFCFYLTPRSNVSKQGNSLQTYYLFHYKNSEFRA